MKKNIFLIVALLLLCFGFSIGGLNFISIFIAGTSVMIYLWYILKKLSKGESKLLKRMYGMYKVLVILFIGLFALIEGSILYNADLCKNNELRKDTEYVLVLGSSLNEYEVSDVLKSRLDEAIKLYEQNNDLNIIVSGGITNNLDISEASVMYDYLVENGVNPGRITLEEQALSTYENIKYTKEILKEKNALNEEILIITSDFHIFRAMMIADLFKIDNYGLVSQESDLRKVNYLLREFPAVVKDIIKSLIHN